MKRRNFLKSSLALGAGLTEVFHQLAAQPTNPSATSNISPAGDLSRRSLFFVPERITALKSQISSDGNIAARWKRFLQRADNLVAGPRERGSTEPGRSGMVLGLAWHISGDAKYANRLRESLLSAANTTLQPGQDADGHSPPWHSWLQTAAMVVNCAVGFDALSDFLSPAERKQVADGMLNHGIRPLLEDWILPEHRIHSLDSMGHNWWSVCVSGAGVGALSLLQEEPRAKEWLAEIETALVNFFDYRGMVLLNKSGNFDPAGAFYEGVHYAGYALESYLTFRLAQINATAVPARRIAVLEHLAEFFVHTLYPTSTGDLAVDFGDSSLKPVAGLTLRTLAALGFSPELTRWYLQRQDPDSIDPLALLYLPEMSGPGRNALPLSVMYPTIGWATLRNSWDNDATFLAVKSGFTWNHAHADAGSFVLYHAGQPLLIDSGKCTYSRREYLDYYCQSRAHNVVLFNGQGQPVEDFHERGVKFPGQVHDLLDGLALKYIYADATGPMARYFSRNYRHWLWVDGVILIFDDLRAHEEGRFDWLLHYAGEAHWSGAAVELSNGRARATVSMLHPANPVITEESGLAADAPDKKVSYFKLSTPLSAREQKFIVAVIPQPVGNAPMPAVELLKEPNALGVRVRGKDQVTDVYLNLQADGRRMHANSINTINGWETDAYLLALTRPSDGTSSIESVTRYFVAGCSYLRRDGKTALDSLSKVTAVFQPGENVEVLFHGQPQVELAVVSRQKPATLRVNQQPTAFEYHADQGTLRFRQGGG